MGNSSTVSELKAVMSIKRFRQDLARNLVKLEEVESKIKHLNNKAIDYASQSGDAASVATWKTKFVKINDTIEAIKQILKDAKSKIEINDRSDNAGMWIEFDALMVQLEADLEDLPRIVVDVLPQTESDEWQKEMRDSEGVFLPMVVAYANACRVELLMLEKCSAQELKQINEFIQLKTPSDFSDEEADKYELDYKSAVAEFLHEFDEEKNLWDRFLDILAGGTHQLPSEHVMLERWLVGDKRDL